MLDDESISHDTLAVPYKKIGENLLNKRAELMKKNEKFSQDICNILKEAAEEKMETASQEEEAVANVCNRR